MSDNVDYLRSIADDLRHLRQFAEDPQSWKLVGTGA